MYNSSNRGIILEYVCFDGPVSAFNIAILDGDLEETAPTCMRKRRKQDSVCVRYILMNSLLLLIYAVVNWNLEQHSSSLHPFWLFVLNYQRQDSPPIHLSSNKIWSRFTNCPERVQQRFTDHPDLLRQRFTVLQKLAKDSPNPLASMGQDSPSFHEK